MSSTIEKLLVHGGAALTSLDIGEDPPDYMSERGKWEDRLDNYGHRLDLTSCSKLESIVVRVYLRPPYSALKSSTVPALSLTGADMLSKMSEALRRVRICVDSLPCVTTLNKGRMLRLQEFNGTLVENRFPNLEEVAVEVCPEYALRKKQGYNWQNIVRGVQRALPGLHERGLPAVRGLS